MDTICGVDGENVEVLKLEIKKLKGEIVALEKERDIYMKLFQKTLAKNLEARKVLEER